MTATFEGENCQVQPVPKVMFSATLPGGLKMRVKRAPATRPVTLMVREVIGEGIAAHPKMQFPGVNIFSTAIFKLGLLALYVMLLASVNVAVVAGPLVATSEFQNVITSGGAG